MGRPRNSLEVELLEKASLAEYRNIDACIRQLRARINSENGIDVEKICKPKEGSNSDDLRTQLIINAFVREWTLEKLNRELADNGCFKIYVRNFWESALSFVLSYNFRFRYEFWKHIQDQVIDQEKEVSIFCFENADLNTLEEFVEQYSHLDDESAFATEEITMQKHDLLAKYIDADLQRELTEFDNKDATCEEFLESDLCERMVSRLQTYLEENNRDQSQTREKAHYYFCKYLYQYLASLIYSFIDGYQKAFDERRYGQFMSEVKILSKMHALHNLISSVTILNLVNKEDQEDAKRTEGPRTPDELKSALKCVNIAGVDLQRLLDTFYYQIPQMDFKQYISTTFDLDHYMLAFRIYALAYARQTEKGQGKESQRYQKLVVRFANDILYEEQPEDYMESTNYKDAYETVQRRVNDDARLYSDVHSLDLAGRTPIKAYLDRENEILQPFADSICKAIPQFKGKRGLHILFLLFIDAKIEDENSKNGRKPKVEYGDALTSALRGAAELNRSTFIAYLLMFSALTEWDSLRRYLQDLGKPDRAIEGFIYSQAMTRDRMQWILARCQFLPLNPSKDPVDSFVAAFLDSDGDATEKRGIIMRNVSPFSFEGGLNPFEKPYASIVKTRTLTQGTQYKSTPSNIFQLTFVKKQLILQKELDLELDKAIKTTKYNESKILRFVNETRYHAIDDILRDIEDYEKNPSEAAAGRIIGRVRRYQLVQVREDTTVMGIKAALLEEQKRLKEGNNRPKDPLVNNKNQKQDKKSGKKAKDK